LVTITYAHHSLIQGNRKGALYGTIFTIILAIIFTGLQGLEYTVSSFTISDSVYGSCFYFGTGFHGLINYVALFIYIYILFKIEQINDNKINSSSTNNKLLINIPSYRNKEANSYYLDKSFIE
jgi:heme/copper-type cytochrome/quinol oxidase subunit 3